MWCIVLVVGLLVGSSPMSAVTAHAQSSAGWPQLQGGPAHWGADGGQTAIDASNVRNLLGRVQGRHGHKRLRPPRADCRRRHGVHGWARRSNVRAFDAVTGALRWRSVDLGASGLSGIVTGLATMAVAGGLVLVPLESPPEVVVGATPVRVRSCGGDPWPRSVGSPRSLWRVTVSLWHSENPAVWSPCNYRPGACCGRQRAAVGNQWDHRRLAQGCWWFPVFQRAAQACSPP